MVIALRLPRASNRNPSLPMQIKVSDMAYGGEAVGRDADSGIVAFAWPAIQGEEVDVAVVSKRNNLVRGLVRRVITPSPLRVLPRCPYFGVCGGCQWQHIAYQGQVEFKSAILSSQLARTGGIADPGSIIKPPVPSPADYHYRNTSHFTIDPGSHTLAYFKRDSHSLEPVMECPISNRGINETLRLINSVLANSSAQRGLREETRGLMQVWRVSIRSSESTGHTLVVFHSKAAGKGRSAHAGRSHSGGHPDEGPTPAAEHANPVVSLVRREVRRAVSDLGLPSALTIIELMDDSTANPLGETRAASALTSEALADTLTGFSLRHALPAVESDLGPPLGAWLERLAGQLYWVAPDSFFQVNTGAAEKLLAEVSAHIPNGIGLLLDAYCGVGTFALALARRAERVIGFEIDRQAVVSARWTAQANGVTNVHFRQGRAELLLPRLGANERPDLVILDPPRSGCQPALLAEIAHRAIPQVVYVSCDPSTLSRDIKLLSPTYRLLSARVIDMFPQTYHLETVVVLAKA